MTILVTGGCGFIGCNLISRFCERRIGPIRVLDNECVGRREWVEEFDVEFVAGDIRDEAAVGRALDGVDTVVHLAADTRVIDSIADPNHNYDVNVRGTFVLLESMRRMRVTRIVNASTGGAIIGEAEPPVHEDMPARPTAPYGASKLAVEGYLSAYATTFGFDAISLRFSNVYGRYSYHKGSVVAAILRAIYRNETVTVYGDGTQTRDYVFAEDLCDGIIKAMECRTPGVYQLGTGIGTPLNDLIQIIRQIVGPRYSIQVAYDDFRAGEVRHTWCDVSKATATLGYTPRTSLRTGIQKTWDWFTANS